MPYLSLESGEAADPEDLSAPAHHGVGVVAVVAVLLGRTGGAHVRRVGAQSARGKCKYIKDATKNPCIFVSFPFNITRV